MNSIFRFSILALALTSTAYAAEPALETDKEKMSYVMGFQVGSQMMQQGFDIDVKALSLAVEDALSGRPPRLDETQAREVMERQQKKLAETQQKQGAVNAEEGKAYLAANKAKPGITTLDNGLQYKVITAGTGKKPKATDNVTVVVGRVLPE